ncbi:hypothetical protein PSTT_00002, partial [Puccinia striiformis]
LPVITALLWFITLTTLFLLWRLLDRGQRYQADEPSIAFVSGVGAAHLLVFTPGCTLVSLFYIMTIVVDRCLRYHQRIPQLSGKWQRCWGYSGAFYAILSGLSLIALSSFSLFEYPDIHWRFTFMFSLSLIISASCQFMEAFCLQKEYPDKPGLRRNAVLKFAVIATGTSLAIIVGVLYKAYGGDVTSRRGNSIGSACAAVEWAVCFLLTFYFLTLALDFWPTVKTSSRIPCHMDSESTAEIENSAAPNSTTDPQKRPISSMLKNIGNSLPRLPVITAVVWFGMLIGLLLFWLVNAHGKRYRPDEPKSVLLSAKMQRIRNPSINLGLFAADIGAAHKGWFTPGCTLVCIFYTMTLLAERWLRHHQRIPQVMGKRQKYWGYSTAIHGIFGGLSLMMLSFLDTFNHPTAHWCFTFTFMIFIAISSFSQIIEVFLLHKEYPDRAHLKRNAALKFSIVSISTGLGIVFGILYLTCGGKPTTARGNLLLSASAICEWSVSFLLTLYFTIRGSRQKEETHMTLIQNCTRKNWMFVSSDDIKFDGTS